MLFLWRPVKGGVWQSWAVPLSPASFHTPAAQLSAGLEAEMESGVRGQRSGSASPLEHSAHVRCHKAQQSGPVRWVMLPLERLRLK